MASVLLLGYPHGDAVEARSHAPALATAASDCAAFSCRARTQRTGALPDCAERLRQVYDVTRIWWFGSLSRGEGGPESDVDIAVEGLSTTDHMRAWAELEQLLQMPIDLVRIEEASRSLRERIDEEGIPL